MKEYCFKCKKQFHGESIEGYNYFASHNGQILQSTQSAQYKFIVQQQVCEANYLCTLVGL